MMTEALGSLASYVLCYDVTNYKYVYGDEQMMLFLRFELPSPVQIDNTMWATIPAYLPCHLCLGRPYLPFLCLGSRISCPEYCHLVL